MRPFTFALANRLGVGGLVQNRTDGVWLEVEGPKVDVARFVDALRREAPPLARIDAIEAIEQAPLGQVDFRIEVSADAAATASFVAPDAATCDGCLRELLDPADRRYRYPFINCTSCGPRLTIVVGAPYDRSRTTMASFELCASCRAEYDDVSDRRFHAQPVACPACGPRLAIEPATRAEPLAGAVALLGSGAIVAIKGLGGYHLACDARNDEAVATLRSKKHRDDKPFALMVADVAAAEALCTIDEAERALLESTARPIVLLRRRPTAAVARTVAPGTDRLGVMLPYTPLHHLLARDTGFPLVMTSGNVTDEPIAYRDADARTRISPLAQATLTHDRPIHVRCDDSVAHVVAGAPAILRRSRGHAPASLSLEGPLARPTLALGGHLKAVFALGAGRDVFLSHHIGDLDHFEAWRSYREAIAHYIDLVRVDPARVACDLHPDYATTPLAERLAEDGLERLVIQHHEAHAAGVLAENGLARAIAVVFDGAGYGHDDTIWGGEFFVGSPGRFVRAAHLRNVRLLGGDRAAREPWRMAVAHAFDAGIDPSGLASDVALRACRKMPAITTSSAGRLFDAVAALTRVRSHASFEAQAAIELQTLAERAAPQSPYSVSFDGDEIDTRPLVRDVFHDVTHGTDVTVIARRFHETIAAAIATTCVALRERHGLADVALTGGVFANALLVERTTALLSERRFRVALSRRVPTNDGGLAYGQMAHVAAQDRES